MPRARHAAFLVAFGLPTYVAFQGVHPDAYGLAGILTWTAVALGVAFGHLPRSVPVRELRIPIAGLLSLTALTALSLAWTESPERTFAELGRITFYAGVVALIWAGLNETNWRSAAAGLSLSIVVVTMAALGSRLAPDLFSVAATDPAFGTRRLSYPLEYWNAVGAWAACSAAVGLAWSAHARLRWVRAISLGTIPLSVAVAYLTYSRAALLVLLLAMALVVAFGGSRRRSLVNCLVGLAGGLLVVLAVRTQPDIANGEGAEGGIWVMVVLAASGVAAVHASRLYERGHERRGRSSTAEAGDHPPGPRLAAKPQRRGSRDHRVPASLLAGIALPIALAVYLLVAPPTVSPLDPAPGLAPGGAGDPASRLFNLRSERPALWGEALEAFLSEPLSGIGPGSFEFWWSREAPEGQSVRDSHSLYLEVAAELGVLGIAALLVLFVGSLRLALRARETLTRTTQIGAWAAMFSVFAVFAVHSSVEWLWEIPAMAVIGLGAVAIAISALSARGHARARLTRIRLAMIIACLVAVGVQVPGVVSDARLGASQDALAAGRDTRALALADDAVRAQPWSASAHAQRAAALWALDDLADANSSISRAIELEQTNWRHPLLAARIAVAEGRFPAARRHLAEVKRLRPAIRALVDQAMASEEVLRSIGETPP